MVKPTREEADARRSGRGAGRRLVCSKLEGEGSRGGAPGARTDSPRGAEAGRQEATHVRCVDTRAADSGSDQPRLLLERAEVHMGLRSSLKKDDAS